MYVLEDLSELRGRIEARGEAAEKRDDLVSMLSLAQKEEVIFHGFPQNPPSFKRIAWREG